MITGEVQHIIVSKEQIHIHGVCRSSEEISVKLNSYDYLPFESSSASGDHKSLASTTLNINTETEFNLVCPRFLDNRDLLYSKFAVTIQASDNTTEPSLMTGIIYATELNDIALYDDPYPIVNTIKGLQVRDLDDALTLGIGHSALNLNQPNIMRLEADDNTVTYMMDGHEYYFDENYLDKFDKNVKTLSDNGILVNLILLNSNVWDHHTISPDLAEVIVHPDYDPEGRISAFNVITEDGLRYYRAFVEFVAERYSQPDAKHGRVHGYIVGNEVDAQWIWCNAGEKTVEEYTREYAIAVRTTFYAARKKYSHARVYLSLTHHWMLPHTKNPKHTYRGRDIIDIFNRIGVDEGNFNWSIAYHPYPEDLTDAEFWKDEKAWDSVDSDLITFKNIQVLPQYMEQPHLQYNGQLRHIILSEQGLHSDETDESEQIQAAAYALAYWKIKQIPQIGSFIYHAHVDHRDEFDLNLGLRRRDKSSDSPNKPADPKPAWFIVRDIEGPNQDEILKNAKEFIGEEYWK